MTTKSGASVHISAQRDHELGDPQMPAMAKKKEGDEVPAAGTETPMRSEGPDRPKKPVKTAVAG